MKYPSIHKKRLLVLLACSAFITLNACLKTSDATLTPVVSLPFSGTNLDSSLAKESSLQLFYRAFKRLALAKDLDNGAGYTIFAPVDSAMKAAGLDEAGIDNMNIDTLRARITYQVAVGALNDQALTQPVTSSYVHTMKRILVTAPSGATTYQYAVMYVKEDDKLYLNGFATTKKGDAIQATNGYIYPVNALATELKSTSTLLDVIATDPDLSMYYQSLVYEDSLLAVNYMAGDLDLLGNTQPRGIYPTILAPTNKAFEDAGFHTMDDIRTYATSTYVGPDPNSFTNYFFSRIDTVLKRHILYDYLIDNSYYNTHTSIRIFYNDLRNPAINNGKLNSYVPNTISLFDIILTFRLPLTFSAVGTEAYVKYDDSPASTSYPIPQSGVYTLANGSLFKIDKLFYPIIN